jgi:membrane protease subunit HflC
MSGRNLTLTFIVLALLLLASNSLFVIKETERGVLLQFGEVVNPNLAPGLHVKIPFVNSVRKFDGRILTVDSTPERYFTQEKKALIVDSYAKFRIADTAKFYTATNGEESRAMALLAQRINDGLRNQVAVRTIQEVVSGERAYGCRAGRSGRGSDRCACEADRPAAGCVRVCLSAYER